MTQAKKGFDLAKDFRALPEREQSAITCFFNAHNTAHFIYEGMSKEAQSYVSACIRMNNDALKQEKENEDVLNIPDDAGERMVAQE